MSLITVAGLTLSVAVYLTLLSRRLSNASPHHTARPRAAPTEEELDSISYEGINMLNGIPKEPTHKGYAVIGGSGFVGINIVRLLLLRGETSVRILDARPPPDDVLSNPAIEFVEMNMASLTSTQTALAKVFERTGKTAEVVYHVAATIRFWERASYTWSASKSINVDGTNNILASLPSTAKILVYTSTGDLCLPRPKHWSLGFRNRTPAYKSIVCTDHDAPLRDDELSEGCYVRSKILAETAVLKADNGVNGLRTGSLRPGGTIIGINDRLVSGALIMPRFPVFDKWYCTTPVDVQDVAAAHLQYEQALCERPDDVAGKHYIISNGDEPIMFKDLRAAIQHYTPRKLILDDLPVLLIFILAHGVEASLSLRYHLLYPFHRIIYGKPPSLLPPWIGETAYLQPATLDFLRDIVLDPSRAQKEIDYRPQWSTLQSIRHIVESFESGKSGNAHGLARRDDYK